MRPVTTSLQHHHGLDLKVVNGNPCRHKVGWWERIEWPKLCRWYCASSRMGWHAGHDFIAGRWNKKCWVDHECGEDKDLDCWKLVNIGKNQSIGSEALQDCESFCYLGSSQDGGCEREILIRLGKTNAVFGSLGRIWASRKISLLVKVRLYESLVLSVLLYGAETWPMKQTSTKKLEAAHDTCSARFYTSRGRTKSQMRR